MLMKRTEYLGLILDGCLNWQERCAGIVLDEAVSGRQIRRLAGDLASTGLMKKDFLFDALECCLSDPGCARLRERRKPMVDLEMLIRDDEVFFMARASAKLFRALLSTRMLEWSSGGKFSYERGDADAVFYPRQLADRSSAAVTLARRLKKYAGNLVLAINDWRNDADVFKVFSGAVSGRPLGASSHWWALLQVWTDGCDRHLPIDRLWDRMSDCDFSKECLKYDEFHHLVVDTDDVVENVDPDADAIKARAGEKLDMLKHARDGAKREEECEETRDQWRRVARNWLCRGFRRRIYHWDDDKRVARNSRGIVGLDREADEVVKYIGSNDSPVYERAKPAYERAKLRIRWPFLLSGSDRAQARDCYIAAVRMATAGSDIDEIVEVLEWPGGKTSLYEFFFLVATQRSGLKVQECWNRLSG